jgi:hypothetical protein
MCGFHVFHSHDSDLQSSGREWVGSEGGKTLNNKMKLYTPRSIKRNAGKV